MHAFIITSTHYTLHSILSGAAVTLHWNPSGLYAGNVFLPPPNPPSLPCSLSFSNLGLTFLLCRLAGTRSVDFSCAAVVSWLAACLSMVAFLKSFQHARGSPRARRIPASSAPPNHSRDGSDLLPKHAQVHPRELKKKKKKMYMHRVTICSRRRVAGETARRAQGTCCCFYHARYLLPYRIAVNPVKKLCGERK